jgi:citrate synthase
MTQHGWSDQLSSAEATRLLRIKPATLYAYVSRGRLRALPVPGTKKRAYLRSDVEALRTRAQARAGHTAAAAAALRYGPPVLDTAISRIDGERGPVYRGRAALDLAAGDASFEAVAVWLWNGEWPGSARPVFAAAESLARPRATSPFQALEAAAFALGRGDRFALPEPVEVERAKRALRLLAASLAFATDARRAEAALRAPSIAAAAAWALAKSADPEVVRVVERCLVLVADHELNPSTFAVRVTASTGAALPACLLAGLAALSGPRHGGARDALDALLDEIERRGSAGDVVRARFAGGDDVPGFFRELYPHGDPRARALLDDPVVGPFVRETRANAAPRALLRAMRDVAGAAAAPSIDLALVMSARACGMPRGSASALFGLGRSAGWIAHVIEQRQSRAPLRPRARYRGR